VVVIDEFKKLPKLDDRVAGKATLANAHAATPQYLI